MLTPLSKRVLIKPNIKTEEVKSGIIVQTAGVKQKTEGVVIEVGKDVTEVKKGDKVIFSPFHYEEISEEVVVIDIEDVWAVVTE